MHWCIKGVILNHNNNNFLLHCVVPLSIFWASCLYRQHICIISIKWCANPTMHQRAVVTWSFLVTNIGLNSLLFPLVSLEENLACHVTHIRTLSDLGCSHEMWLAESRHQNLIQGSVNCSHHTPSPKTSWRNAPVLATSIRYWPGSGTLWHVVSFGKLFANLWTLWHYYY